MKPKLIAVLVVIILFAVFLIQNTQVITLRLYLENIHVSDYPDTISPPRGIRIRICFCEVGWRKASPEEQEKIRGQSFIDRPLRVKEVRCFDRETQSAFQERR